MLFPITISALIAAALIVKTVRALWRDERYRLGWLEGGFLRGRTVDPKWMALAVTTYCFGLSAILACPAGICDRIAARKSPCRQLVTRTDLERLAPGVFTEAETYDVATSCSFTTLAPGPFGRFQVDLAGPHDREVDLLPPAEPDAIARADGTRETVLSFEHEGGRGRVILPRGYFGDEQIQSVTALVAARGDQALAPFTAARLSEPWWREHRDAAKLAVLVSLVMIAVLFLGSFAARRRERRFWAALD